MFWDIVHAVDITVWCIMALSVGYIAFFAVASLAGSRGRKTSNGISGMKNRFLVIFPAYGEDKVIENSVRTFINQNYPDELYTVTVVSDHMKPSTNYSLAQLNINLLQPTFDKSSKAKAMQYAIQHNASDYDHVVILDADNIVGVDFLEKLNDVCNMGYNAIQCHRCAKNCNNNIAALDGISEEINNSIFRLGHIAVGLPAAISGSGMAFDFNWFKDNIVKTNAAWEDKELEALLIRQHIYVDYFDHILVFDEKTRRSKDFNRQRGRWATTQFYTILKNIKYLPTAILNKQYDLMDKIFQWMLMPRTIMMGIIVVMSLALPFIYFSLAIKWWIMAALILLVFAIATPDYLVDKRWERSFFIAPFIMFRSILNLVSFAKAKKNFVHKNK